MTLELFAAGVMLVGLVVYAVTGGADFGGGVWDLLARGPRADAQRKAIERALAPVWEANHVWLIFVVVVLFTAFPPAFARLGIELHMPVTLLLIGIVLRGSAFVFRQYGSSHQRRWGVVFAVSSTLASWFLGCILGAMTTGAAWWHPFPVATGVLTVAAFAFIAAVYLTVEIADPALRGDFRRRAFAAAAVLVPASVAAALLARREAPGFAGDLLGASWSGFVVAGFAIALAATLVCLRRDRVRVARVGASAVVSLLVLGWGVAHYPLVFAPDLTLARAAAPEVTLRALVPILVVGSLLLLPSLWWLMRVFKQRPQPPEDEHAAS